MAAKQHLDPKSLVARIIAELQANPDAQRLLLRALLTNEFLGMPARLDRIEKDIAELKADVSSLKTDMAQLKGNDLENRLHRRLRALASHALGLRRPRVVQSPLQEPKEDFADRVEEAVADRRITAAQETRIEATDFIMHAQRRSDGAAVWVAVEASNRVHAKDIQRARATAEALKSALDADALAVVVGYGIDPRDAQGAEATDVRYLEVSPAHPN